MKVNIFVKSKKNHFFYSDDKAVQDIRDEINIILKNDLSFDNDIIHKGYVLYSVKHIIKNKKFYELYIYYIPKFWSTESLPVYNNIISKEHENFLIEKINNFIIDIKKIDKTHNKKNKSFDIGKKNTIFFEFEYDLFILKKVLSLLNRTKNYKEKKIVYSEVLLGELNHEINKLNNDQNIFAQNIYINNDKLYFLVNSYLQQKFNKKYTKFLTSSKKSLNTVFRDIIRTLNNIKKITKYDKQTQFLAKDLIKRTLIQANYKKIFENNKKLFSHLNLLLKSKVNISNSKHYRKVFLMDKVWEKYVEKKLTIYGEIQGIQSEKKFIIGEHPTDSRSSIPDLFSDCTVIDAKYKELSFKNGLIKNIDMNDINKLIRDVIFHNKNKGVLVFPMKCDLFSNDNVEYKIHKYKLLGGLSYFSIDIVELYFK
jgi:hypothetical protein